MLFLIKEEKNLHLDSVRTRINKQNPKRKIERIVYARSGLVGTRCGLTAWESVHSRSNQPHLEDAVKSQLLQKREGEGVILFKCGTHIFTH